jgi:hypothetical protein
LPTLSAAITWLLILAPAHGPGSIPKAREARLFITKRAAGMVAAATTGLLLVGAPALAADYEGGIVVGNQWQACDVRGTGIGAAGDVLSQKHYECDNGGGSNTYEGGLVVGNQWQACDVRGAGIGAAGDALTRKAYECDNGADAEATRTQATETQAATTHAGETGESGNSYEGGVVAANQWQACDVRGVGEGAAGDLLSAKRYECDNNGGNNTYEGGLVVGNQWQACDVRGTGIGYAGDILTAKRYECDN